MHLLELPEEVLVKIFRKCTTYEIFKRLAFVCTDFYRISKDSEVIKEIKLAGCNSPIRNDESYKYLYEVIKRSSGLTNFSIEQRADNHKLIQMVLQFCPKLHSLTIINCRISTACINEIIEFISRYNMHNHTLQPIDQILQVLLRSPTLTGQVLVKTRQH